MSVWEGVVVAGMNGKRVEGVNIRRDAHSEVVTSRTNVLVVCHRNIFTH